MSKGERMGVVKTIVLVIALFGLSAGAFAAQYEITKVSNSVYAAIARPEGKVASNAVFFITDYEVILAGAHFIPEGMAELMKEIARITPLPVNQVILTHHHKGYNYVDFDLPERAEVVASTEVWQALTGETRQFRNPTVVFEQSLTLNRGKMSLVVIDAGPGHSLDDLIIYLPKEGILFASDLLFNDSFGYMGEAFIHEWGESLDLMERLEPTTVIPGVGKVADGSLITRFKKFYRAFMTEVIRNVEKGNTLAQTKKEFNLDQYKKLPGYDAFLDVNLERAYKQYKARR
jgi:glyoxylase-like metal-dependent hydrolase (beta-lactamase superfamily II)